MSELRASELMKKGCNCAQAVFVALSEEAGVSEEQAMRMACPFGGGARAGELCGIVAGALLALGMRTGNSDASDKETRAKSDAVTMEFNRRFREAFGNLSCKDLLGCNTSTPEGKAYLKEHPDTKKNCPVMADWAVAEAKKILAELK